MKKGKELIQWHSSEIVDAANQNGESCEPFSLLEGDESFFSRILSRDTFLGMSSRFYYRGEARVPFEWEVQPGMPKALEQNVTDDLLPPLSPPPAALFSYLSPGRSGWKEAVVKDKDAARSNKLQWFWKTAGRGRRRQRTSAVRTATDSETGSEYYTSFEHKAFVSSSTSSNASSSSTSSTSCSSSVYSRIKDAQVHGISLRWVRRLCTAWHNGVFVSRTNRS